MTFLQSDGLSVKIIPDVASAPLRSPLAHQITSQYTLHFLLVPEAEADRARELIELYLAEENTERSEG